MDNETLLFLAALISVLPICGTVYLIVGILTSTSAKEALALRNVLIIWYGLTFLIGTAVYFISGMSMPYVLSLSAVWFLIMCFIS